MPKRYPPEFRRKVLDLVAAGRRVSQVAADLDISEQTIYVWHRQRLIDTGQLPEITSTHHAELVTARRRIAELEAEVEIHRRAAELLKEVAAQKTLRGDRGDGLTPSPPGGRAALPRPPPLRHDVARGRRRTAQHGAAGHGARAVVDHTRPLHAAHRQQQPHPRRAQRPDEVPDDEHPDGGPEPINAPA